MPYKERLSDLRTRGSKRNKQRVYIIVENI